MKRLLLYAILSAAVAFALAGILSAASALWQPLGTHGIVTDYGANVRSVVPGGPADRAAIVAGDRIDLARTPFDERRFVVGVGAAPVIGATIRIGVIHAGASRDVRLVAIAQASTREARLSLLLQCLAALIFVGVGTSLIVLRPSPATWGFGLYCLLDLPTAVVPFRIAGALPALAVTLTYDVIQNLGVVGLLVFALEFPRRIDGPYRRGLRRALVPIFVVLSAMTLYPDIATQLLARSAERENHVLQIVFGAVFLLALGVLYDTYRRIDIADRERMRWVLIGFGLGLVVSYIGTTLMFSSLVNVTPPLWLSSLLVSLAVLLPLTVAHAVVRHRVLDIDFVIARTLIFAAMTTALAALFGLLDWLFGSFLEEFHLARVLQAAAAIGMAFAFDRVHKRTEAVIEAVFFRKRRATEVRLKRYADELSQARSEQAIEAVLVDETIDALALTSAAVYRSRGERFERTASHGWSDTDGAALDDGDLLVLELRSQPRSIRLANLPWRRLDIPGAGRAPVIAIPMCSRGALAGIVIYGAHANGGDIDPEEIGQLERLAAAAVIGFDRIEADRLRAEFERQGTELHEIQARLDELRLSIPRP